MMCAPKTHMNNLGFPTNSNYAFVSPFGPSHLKIQKKKKKKKKNNNITSTATGRNWAQSEANMRPCI